MPAGWAVTRKIQKWKGKKRRTREHVLAELGVNFIQKEILLKNHSSETIVHDYGIDLIMYTYNSEGEIENGQVEIQVKSTDNLATLKVSGEIAIRVELAHLKDWQFQPMPVILILYDSAEGGRAFWLYVQKYMNERREPVDLSADQDTVTLRVPVENRLDGNAIDEFRRFRDQVLAQVRGVISHDG